MGQAQIQIQIQGRGINAFLDRLPNECPICFYAAEIAYFSSGREEKIYNLIATGDDGHPGIQLLCRCPRQECRHAFIATYFFERDHGAHPAWQNFTLAGVYPKRFQEPQLPNEVKAISSQFAEIYNQAAEAESKELDKLAGMGYRKALEFLIKDYIVFRDPAKKNLVENTALANCIKDHVDNPKIQSLAERVTWLGGDETHYQKKYVGFDLADMKKLLEAIIYWIQIDGHTEHYGSILKKK